MDLCVSLTVYHRLIFANRYAVPVLTTTKSTLTNQHRLSKCTKLRPGTVQNTLKRSQCVAGWLLLIWRKLTNLPLVLIDKSQFNDQHKQIIIAIYWHKKTSLMSNLFSPVQPVKRLPTNIDIKTLLEKLLTVAKNNQKEKLIKPNKNHSRLQHY